MSQALIRHPPAAETDRISMFDIIAKLLLPLIFICAKISHSSHDFAIPKHSKNSYIRIINQTLYSETLMIDRVVNIAKSHKEADEYDIQQQLAMTPEERFAVAAELKRRFYGEKNPDVRESREVHVFIRKTK